MKSQLALAISALAALAAVACGAGAETGGRLRVVATTTQIGDFARNVGGDRIALTVLLKPNQDAHDFEPSPSQIRALAQADVILRNGIGLDVFVTRAAGVNAAKITVVSRGIDLREGGDAVEGHDAAAEAGGHDPHVWFSAANARKMAANVRDALAAADPANAALYSDNADRYDAELAALDAWIRAQVREVPPACRKLVTNHDTLGYYAVAYGFEVVGSVVPSVSTDARPSAADVAEIVRLIRAERVPAVFAEASINPALIRQVAREAGVKVVDDLYSDSLGLKGSDGDTYVKMMQANTRKIVEALKAC